MASMLLSAHHWQDKARGVRPLPFNAMGGELGFFIKAKQSPPTPVMCGSTTHCTAQAAIQASARNRRRAKRPALPPKPKGATLPPPPMGHKAAHAQNNENGCA